MNILFITHKFYPDIGGIEVNSEVLATEFYKADYNVRVVTSTKNKGDRSFPFSIVRNPNIITLVKQHYWADIVFENNPSLRLSWPNFFWKRPIVIALRTWIARNDGSLGREDKLKFKWLKRASGVIAVSEAVRKRTWTDAIVIGNPYRNTLFRLLPSIKKDKDFVFLGRLVSDKGADIAVRALQLIAPMHETELPTLTIIGDGPDRKSLETLVTNLQLEAQVKFTGSLGGEALVACLNQHRILLVPSLWEEPFGNVALEGMACGCVPVVSDGGGLPDAVGKAGLICKRGDIEDIAACMNALYTNSGLEEHYRSLANEHLLSHKPEVVANKYLDIIKAAANKS